MKRYPGVPIFFVIPSEVSLARVSTVMYLHLTLLNSINPTHVTELGRIKGSRKQFEDQVEVDDTNMELELDEEETKTKYWKDTDVQKILRSLARLGNWTDLFLPNDIIEDLEENASYSMTMKILRPLLKVLHDKCLLRKSKANKDEYLQVPNVRKLILFMNPKKGEIPQIPDEDEDEQSIGSETSSGSSNKSASMSQSVSSKEPSGTREAPIELLDSDDEDEDVSMSDLSMATADRKRNMNPRRTKAVTPESKGDQTQSSRDDERSNGSASPSEPTSNRSSGSDDSASSMSKAKKTRSSRDTSEDFVGNRVAKYFSNKLYFGSVEKYCDNTEEWHVLFDDGDCFDFNKEDLRKGIRCYKRNQAKDHTKPKSKESSITSNSSNLTNIEDIEHGDTKSISERGSVKNQPGKKRRTYYTDEGDTVRKIAKKFKMDPRQIIRDNKRRPNFETMNMATRFTVNSPVVLPLAIKEEDAEVPDEGDVKVEV